MSKYTKIRGKVSGGKKIGRYGHVYTASRNGAKKGVRKLRYKSVRRITEEGSFLLVLKIEAGVEFALIRRHYLFFHDWINIKV